MAELPDAARRIGLATVDALADLHLADPDACGLGDLGRADGFLDRQLAGWSKRWDLVSSPEHAPTMDAAAAELAARQPKSPPGTFLHNDFKLDNCQFKPGQPDRVTSVFDWDMATLGDPFVDFGTLLNYWPDPSDTPDDRALHVPGMERLGLPPRIDVVERYAARTGFDVGDVAWYEAFACWRVAIICQQLYQRYSAARAPTNAWRAGATTSACWPTGPAASSPTAEVRDGHRSVRQSGPRHRRQPGSRTGDGARLRPSRC